MPALITKEPQEKPEASSGRHENSCRSLGRVMARRAHCCSKISCGNPQKEPGISKNECQNDKENKNGPASREQLQVADKPPPPSRESVSGQTILPRQRDPPATVTLDEFGMTRRFGPLK